MTPDSELDASKGAEPEPEPEPELAGPTQTSTWWRILKIGVGVVLVPLGIVGLFIPVLQGVLFLLLAVALLATEVPAVARLRDALRERYPKPFEQLDRFTHELKERFR